MAAKQSPRMRCFVMPPAPTDTYRNAWLKINSEKALNKKTYTHVINKSMANVSSVFCC